MMKKQYLSTEHEPAFHVEHLSESGSGMEKKFSSVWNEPWLCQSAQRPAFPGESVREKTKHSVFSLCSISVAVGVMGGLFAVPGCFIAYPYGFVSSNFAAFFMVCIAPFQEEVLKQSGMIWLLEKRPHLLRSWVQFYLAAFAGG